MFSPIKALRSLDSVESESERLKNDDLVSNEWINEEAHHDRRLDSVERENEQQNSGDLFPDIFKC